MENSGMKGEEEEEAKSLDRQDAETSSAVGGVDQSVGYIVCFANVVKLYQGKIKIVSDVVVLTIL